MSALNNLVDNSDVCDNDFKEPPVSQLSQSNAPSLASQPNSHSCSYERSKGVEMENKCDQCSTSYNHNKHICFNCGVGGHIARNCQNHMFVHFEFPRGENEFRGRSLTRKSSRNHSRNDDWKDDRSRKRAVFQKHKKVFHYKVPGSLPKPSTVKPMSVSSTNSNESSNNSGRKPTCFKQTDKHSKSPGTNRKPNYQWLPKQVCNSSSVSSEKSKNYQFEKASGLPRKEMTWIPKSN